MAVFSSYSRYYDLLYRDKDYAAEARYVDALVQKYCPGAATILNLGCGTGRHDIELAELGYLVTGVDLSAQMLESASEKAAERDCSAREAASPAFVQGDIRTVRMGNRYDAVTALFHVMSYQTSNQDLRASFATARAHLDPGGLFLFDCWYGPAVLSDPPVTRVKRLQDQWINVLRIAEPVQHFNENVVDVNYQVLVTDNDSGATQDVRETHRMRYLFFPEVQDLFSDNGMSLLAAEEWMTSKVPGADTWGVCFVGAVN